MSSTSQSAPATDEWEPIPLTAFEAMMFVDDRPGYSLSCAAELRFDGVIQRELLDAAFQQAIRRHKLLRAVVVKQGDRLNWSWTRSIGG